MTWFYVICRYLEEQSVLAVVLEVATELWHSSPDVPFYSDRDGKGAPQHVDIREGTSSTEAVASLVKSLQASSLMQHLEVPALHMTSETLGTVRVSDISSAQGMSLF